MVGVWVCVWVCVCVYFILFYFILNFLCIFFKIIITWEKTVVALILSLTWCFLFDIYEIFIFIYLFHLSIY